MAVEMDWFALGSNWCAHDVLLSAPLKANRRRANDTVDGIALYRSAGVCLARPNRIGCRWRIHPSLPLVDHGRTIRRKISECLCVARRRLRGSQPSMAGL